MREEVSDHDIEIIYEGRLQISGLTDILARRIRPTFNIAISSLLAALSHSHCGRVEVFLSIGKKYNHGRRGQGCSENVPP